MGMVEGDAGQQQWVDASDHPSTASKRGINWVITKARNITTVDWRLFVTVSILDGAVPKNVGGISTLPDFRDSYDMAEG